MNTMENKINRAEREAVVNGTLGIRENVKGICFIKSRKAYINVLEINREIYETAKRNGVLITDFYVDESNSRDYDREELTELIDHLENGTAQVLVLRDLHEIADNTADIKEFIIRAERNGVKIYCMQVGPVEIRVKDDECGC